MAYWWAYQSFSFRHDRDGGRLWAPDEDDAGRTPFHWANLNHVQPGDIIFSIVKMKIVAVGVAKSSAIPSLRPRDQGLGGSDYGKLIKVVFRELPESLALRDIRSEFQPLLPEKYSPLKDDGTGNKGFVYSLPPHAGRFLLERIEATSPHVIEGAFPNSTERDALIQSRIGQGRFRDELMRIWRRRCAVTGLDLPSVLRASHIKPWRDSDNRERLDPYNGLLLSPSYDAAFDGGIITFDDRGGIRLAAELTPSRASILGISPDSRIGGLHQRHLEYLDFHRRNVFLDC